MPQRKNKLVEELRAKLLRKKRITITDVVRLNGGHLRLAIERDGVTAFAHCPWTPSDHRSVPAVLTQCEHALRDAAARR